MTDSMQADSVRGEERWEYPLKVSTKYLLLVVTGWIGGSRLGIEMYVRASEPAQRLMLADVPVGPFGVPPMLTVWLLMAFSLGGAVVFAALEVAD